MVLSDLAEFTHFVTRVKVVPAVADDVVARRGRAHARPRASPTKLSMRVLSRTWQMLFKGLAEVQEAGRPLAAAEMVLVRIAYAADLPTPDEVIRVARRQRRGAGAARARGNGGGAARAATVRAALRRAARRAARRASRPRSSHRAGAGQPIAGAPQPAAAADACASRRFDGADRARGARSATSR